MVNPKALRRRAVLYRTVSHRQPVTGSQLSLFALPIVKHLDILRNLSYRLLARSVLSVMHQLCLQQAPEAFHRGVVITIAFSTHRCCHAKLLKQLSLGRSTVLAAPV